MWLSVLGVSLSAPPSWVSASLPLLSFPLSVPPLSPFVPPPSLVSEAPSLLWVLPLPFFWSFSSSLLYVDVSFPLFLAFPTLLPTPACAPAGSHTPPPWSSPRSQALSLVAVRCLQGVWLLSRVCHLSLPSLYLLAQPSAATLGWREVVVRCSVGCVGGSWYSPRALQPGVGLGLGLLLSRSLSWSQQAGAVPGMLIPGADSHWAQTAQSDAHCFPFLRV